MEYPFGHRHNHPHHRRDDDDGDGDPRYPSPPPPPVHVSHIHHRRDDDGGDGDPRYASPPPPPVHVSHIHHRLEELNEDPERPAYPPPPFGHPHHPPPPPPPAEVVHVSHVSHYPPPREEYENPFRGGGNRDDADDEDRRHGHHGGGVGSLVYHHTHTHDGGPSAESEFSGKATVKVYSKAGRDFVMAVRHGKVILAQADPADDAQHWYKDEKYSTKVKDQDGFPCFSLINKATGQALKHSLGPTHPVQLIPYNSNALDESVLWTEGRDQGDGFRPIRMVNNVRLNVDAFHGDKKSGGVHDGTTIVLWEWNKGDNQKWKIVPYSN